MSTRTDQYLSLCLSEAARSPLHYRHGAIIVRGGKVLGQGHNTYRLGFNGGALKTGVLTAGGLDGPAIVELKSRLKLTTCSKKQSSGLEQCLCDDAETSKQVEMHLSNPYDSMLKGPLSMHSEMMAIQSALDQTSTRPKKWLQKPAGSSLSSGSKKRSNRGIVSYVRAACAVDDVKSYETLPSVQGSCFERGTENPCSQTQEGGEGPQVQWRETTTSLSDLSTD